MASPTGVQYGVVTMVWCAGLIHTDPVLKIDFMLICMFERVRGGCPYRRELVRGRLGGSMCGTVLIFRNKSIPNKFATDRRIVRGRSVHCAWGLLV